MGQPPQLDSMRQDAELAAITGNSPSSTKQDKEDSIYASAKYMVAKRQYLKSHPPSKPAAPPSSDAAPPSDKKQPAKVPSYKKGGMVKKTGLAKLHAGEKVVRKQDVKRTVKAVRKYGGKR